MIKVLIVDDDKLVRKGISSAMPWDEFDMEVVGEASNGLKALDFLKTQPVDLMLTDLAMPVMSGIELMRACEAPLSRTSYRCVNTASGFRLYPGSAKTRSHRLYSQSANGERAIRTCSATDSYPN